MFSNVLSSCEFPNFSLFKARCHSSCIGNVSRPAVISDQVGDRLIFHLSLGNDLIICCSPSLYFFSSLMILHCLLCVWWISHLYCVLPSYIWKIMSNSKIPKNHLKNRKAVRYIYVNEHLITLIVKSWFWHGLKSSDLYRGVHTGSSFSSFSSEKVHVKTGDIGERRYMTSISSDPIWRHGSWWGSALLRRLAFAGHFKRWREGSAPFNWPSEPKKESNFSARFDSIWLCTGLGQNHITWIWWVGSAANFWGSTSSLSNLFWGRLHLQFYEEGGGQLWKHIDNLDPLLQEAIHNSKWFAHAMQLSMPIDHWPGSKDLYS